MKIAVLSDGAWGTAIAILLRNNGNQITLWGPFEDNVREINKTGRNDRFLKGVSLPDGLTATTSMADAVAGARIVVLAAPTQFARRCIEQLSDTGPGNDHIVVNVAKGIELGTLMRISEMCADILDDSRYAVLSGPSHAEEVARGVPTAVVVASTCPDAARDVQACFMNNVFRVYTSTDVVGVELGGALKNVYAIAAGISDGMKLGDNAKAALITRGIAELARMGKALGGKATTFSGLSGVGDMIVTCSSGHSRNRFVGEQLGQGVALKSIVAGMGMVVAEGIATTSSAHDLARKIGVDVPIIDEVYAGLYHGKDLRQGVRDLMTRKAREECD